MRKKRLKRMMEQFVYDHRKLDGHFVRVRKSADELSRLLDNMAAGKKKDEKT